MKNNIVIIKKTPHSKNHRSSQKLENNNIKYDHNTYYTNIATRKEMHDSKTSSIMNKNKLIDIISREIDKSRIEHYNVRNNKSNHKGNNEKPIERKTTNLNDKYKFENKNPKIQTQNKEK